MLPSTIAVRRVAAIASLFLGLDRRAASSLTEQIANALRDAIAGRVLAPGTRLPAARALAAELAVSRTTIVAALTTLIEEGLLATRARSGTFVAEELPAERAPATLPVAGRRSPLRLARRTEELARATTAPDSPRPRPLAFRLSRPALDAFPVRTWSRLLTKRTMRVTAAQLDYGQESPDLRAVIADLASAARGMRVHAEQVFIFGGGQRALEFAAGAILDPGDEAWMEDPGYPGARHVLVAAGARVHPVPVDAQGLRVADGAAAAPHARLVYVTPSCQFPLGVTLSLPRRRQLLRFAESAGAAIIEDDYDAEFRHAGAPLPALSALDPGRVLYASSFSRTMFPALRLGYLVVPEGLVDRLRAARATMEEALPVIVQLALADFIAEGHYVRHLRRMRVIYRARRDALVAAASAHGLRVRPALAGLHVVVDLPRSADARVVSAAAALRGVEAAPLADYYAGGQGSPPALVLGFGAVHESRVADAVERLALAVGDAR